MRWTMAVASLVAALTIRPAAAHESADRVMGIVERVTAQELVLKATDGHTVVFAITPETRFTDAGTPVPVEEIQPGRRVAVHGKKAGERIEAVWVKLGPMPPKKKGK
jgi:hypothetical protein